MIARLSTGPGRYDDACTAARQATDASSIVLLVIGGNRGSGYSVQAVDPQLLERLPGLLRFVAEEIKRDLEET